MWPIPFIKSIFKKARQKPGILNSFKYGLREDCKYRFFYKIKTYYPLNTFGYDKKKAIAILKKEVNEEAFTADQYTIQIFSGNYNDGNWSSYR